MPLLIHLHAFLIVISSNFYLLDLYIIINKKKNKFLICQNI